MSYFIFAVLKIADKIVSCVQICVLNKNWNDATTYMLNIVSYIYVNLSIIYIPMYYYRVLYQPNLTLFGSITHRGRFLETS